MCPGLGGSGLRGGVFSGGGREAAEWRETSGAVCARFPVPAELSVCPSAGSGVTKWSCTLTRSGSCLHRCRVRSLSPFTGNDVSAESSGAPNNGPALQRPWGSARGAPVTGTPGDIGSVTPDRHPQSLL